ncbi:MAG TPA: HEAT repeat domain-containing protein, partial [Planctomycetaceae bacterium]|nr:HEAT repeat domain-containing protein [Planctomycetaceae bacterium]
MQIASLLIFLLLMALTVAPGCQVLTAGTREPSRPRQEQGAFDADAWCRELLLDGGDPFEALAPAGRRLERPDLPDADRAALFVAVSRSLPPAVVPGLSEALEPRERSTNPRDPIRRAALAACLVHALQHRPEGSADDGTWAAFAGDATRWPAGLLHWHRDPRQGLSDPDPDVRQTFLQWLAAVRHPQTLELARQQQLDSDPRVRTGALAALGLFGGDAARAELDEEARRTSGRARAAVVHALAGWGWGAVAPFVDDESWEVRQAVAEELARFPSVASAAMLQNLAVARAPQVQDAAIRGVQT